MKLIGLNDNGQVGQEAIDALVNSGIPSTDSMAALDSRVSIQERRAKTLRKVSYPSYWWASFYQEDPDKDLWKKTLSDPATAGYVIINPNSGPGDEVNSDWATQADIARTSGATVLGYISTDYANKAIARDGSRTYYTIAAEARKYVDWYSVDGFFLDETSNGWSDEQAEDHIWYEELTSLLRDEFPNAHLIGNAGANTRPEYLPLFDVLVTFENSAENYLAASPQSLVPDHYKKVGPGKFWHMIHDITSEDQARGVLEKASQSNVSNIYLTDDSNAHEPPAMWGNPYDVPPTAWLLDMQRKWARGLSLDAPVSGGEDTPDVSTRRNRVSIIGDSFSSTGYGSNYGHIWHTVAMSHADGTLVGNYAANGHTTADAIEGRDSSWGPDLPNAQLTKAKNDASQSVIVCLGYNDENNSVPRETFETNMRRIARELRDAGKRAIIMQPPIPVRARAAAIPSLKAYLANLPALCDEEGAVYLHTWDLIGDDLGLPPAYDQGDGSHMNSSGHDAVGQAVAPRLRKAIDGLGEYAAAIRTPMPLTVGIETMTDAESTAKVVTVPESSRDIFPTGEAILMDLGIGDDTYVSLGVPYRGDNLAGSRLKFTFSYEIVSMPADKVSNSTTNAGLHVQGGTFDPWVFTTLWGGVKLQGSRGVASVVTTVPAGVTEYVYALTLLGIQRVSGDAPAQVRVGAGRVERI